MATVHIGNISPQTTEIELKEFFSYCGEFENFEYKPVDKQPGTASITFKRDTAAQTARLLDNTELNGTPVKVEVAASLSEIAGSHQASGSAEELKQEDKPRAAIFAEYLARGYVIGDQALERGIELDKKHGVSQRFNKHLEFWNNKFKPVETARSVDQTYGVVDKATQGYITAQRYFEKVVGPETTQKIRAFYAQTQNQVVDIHNEARRLADMKKPQDKKEGASTCGCSGSDSCTCAPGTCGCASCHGGAKEAAPVAPAAPAAAAPAETKQ